MPNTKFKPGQNYADFKIVTPSSVAMSMVLAAVVFIAAPARAGAPEDKPMIRVPAKANSAGVGVVYRLEGEPKVGAETVVVVVLTPASGGGPATARFSADPGLELKNAPRGDVTLDSDGASTFRIGVVPDSHGLSYLNVFTSQNGGASSISIAVQAGKLPPKGALGTLKTAPDGQRLISQPVK